MPSIVNGPAMTSTAVPTPARISPEQLKASHAAAAVQVDGAKDEAKFDIDQLLSNSDKEARDAAAVELVNLVKLEGPQAFVRLGLADAVRKGLTDKKNAAAREGACSLLSTMCEQGVGHAVEPFVFQSEPSVLHELVETLGDKLPVVRTAALDALRSLIQVMTPWALGLVLPELLGQIKTAGKWQVKTGSLELLDQLVISAADQMARAMPDVVPVLAGAIWDTKAEVKKGARASLTKACALVSNKDIEKFIPALISALINPVEEVPKCIQLLAATTFVSEVDAPTLSLMSPLLTRGCNERLTATKRKVAVIADNMAKLVDSEVTVRPFLPTLLPALLKMADTVGDPEARGVVNRAIKTLREIGQVPAGSDGTDLPPLKQASSADVAKRIAAAIKSAGGDDQRAGTDPSSPLVRYIAELGAALVNARNFETTEWDSSLVAYVSLALPPSIAADKAQPVVREVLEKSAQAGGEEVEAEEEDEEGEDLCNCTFSLAYGAKILLNTATMRLKRGHRYGLCGRNGSGKSTLMRAIHNGQVEGFPSPDEVRTFYVEHDIDGSEAEISIIDWVVADKRIQATKDEIVAALAEVGFSKDRQSHAIGSLSGGWKMKLALARAILFKADILLLDEPTNHLDVLNVQWLMDYLKGLTTCTSIIVSHDSGFLDNVCTNILHLNRFKLRVYKGALREFVKKVPEAKAYYELAAQEEYQFKLPNPPFLDGVKTKEKSLMKMRNVGFQYPSAPAPQLVGITLQVSLSSRVAVLGPNGAGKSTLVKVLLGQLEPNSGDVHKHPSLVVGYVAQHAFHHIDHHLDETPLQYMLNRYQTGEDIEELSQANRKLTPEEEKALKEGANMVVEGQKRVIDEVLNRKKLKQSFEYEVSFKGLSSSENIWIPRDDLIKRGFEKRLIEIDSREAQKAGLLRPLVRKEIESHFNDFGLEPEFVSHNTMRGLSGGQKVKVVLGAATWRRPHVLILDEPTNYLDRESLAALIEALKSFEGGVLIITHNREFSESVCSEVWAMRDGHLTASGHNWVEGQGSGPRLENKEADEETFDAMGNKIENKKKKKVTSKDERKLKKERMARKRAGLPSDDEGDL